MSEKSHCVDPREEIRRLDARFAIYEAHKLKNPRWIDRVHEHQSRFLQKIYKTRHIARRPLLTRPEWVEIPPELLVKCTGIGPSAATGRRVNSPVTVLPGNAAMTYVNVPDELLWPKPLSPQRKRGRPRNKTLAALAKEQRCTERHARRLLASGRKRERGREPLSPSEKWALEQGEKRAALVGKLEENQRLDCVASGLDILMHGLDTACLSSSVSSQARNIAKQIADNRGIDTAVLLCNFALKSSGLRFASRVLGVSRRTIYRRFRGQFGRLRSDGQALRDFDLSHAKRLSKRRVDTEGSENALSLQTNWMPKVALRLQAH